MMQFDFRHIVAGIVSFFLGWVTLALILSLNSCSAKYHLNKFQAKGGVCGKVDTIKVMRYDTLTNEYRYFDSLVIVNDRVVPLTRTEIKYMYKIHRDTIRLKEKEIKYLEKRVKEETKQAKEETKQVRAENNKWLIWLIFGIIGLLAFVLIKFK